MVYKNWDLGWPETNKFVAKKMLASHLLRRRFPPGDLYHRHCCRREVSGGSSTNDSSFPRMATASLRSSSMSPIFG
jgi:hypothetical protein